MSEPKWKIKLEFQGQDGLTYGVHRNYFEGKPTDDEVEEAFREAIRDTMKIVRMSDQVKVW